MANRYTQVRNTDSETHFSAAVTGDLEHSRMNALPVHYTTFNAGDIVPIYCNEVLPSETLEMSLDFVIRQTTVLAPTMGQMDVDFYAFFVPNRIVNKSWQAVMGENADGSWKQKEPISLAPLLDSSRHPIGDEDDNLPSTGIKIPVGSVADYYDLATQMPIPSTVLEDMNDLPFRGYIEIYNEFFRDQNYQAPIPYSKLNIYENFFHLRGRGASHVEDGSIVVGRLGETEPEDDSVGSGAIKQAIYGNLKEVPTVIGGVSLYDVAYSYRSTFNILGRPLKANKRHDYFTSGLPSPQKSTTQVMIPVSINSQSAGAVPVVTTEMFNTTDNGIGIKGNLSNTPVVLSSLNGGVTPVNTTSRGPVSSGTAYFLDSSSSGSGVPFVPLNLAVDAEKFDLGGSLSVSDLRLAASIQQVYEQLARGGSRYREFVRSFFGLDVEDPYRDIPEILGHFRRSLDLFQTAQTSSSQEGGTPQGNLAAFGYTSKNGWLFRKTFLEHGYVHIFAVVRHKNIYGSFLPKHHFRRNMLDWYLPQLANISEQPIIAREVNPFKASNNSQPFAYQEAWAEYRYEPDRVSGYMRPGVDGSLALWNYADDFDPELQISDGDWLKSNSEEVLNRSLAVTSQLAHQFKGQFTFFVNKDLPMPTYDMPGKDII